MRVFRLSISHFRGFDKVEILTQGDVLAVGEPHAGRSDIIEALARVLDANSTRRRLDAWDFHKSDATLPISIEVVLGELDAEQQQRFVDQLELWSTNERDLVTESEDLAELPDECEWALRLTYRGTWSTIEEIGDHFVHYAKFADPEIERFDRVSRADRLSLPFAVFSEARPLEIRAEGQFRSIVEARDSEGGLSDALRKLASDVEATAADLSKHPAVLKALEAVLTPLVSVAGGRPAQDIVKFSPGDGSVQTLLRALTSSVDTGDGAGHLPLERHASTLTSLFSAAEMLVLAANPSAIIAVDDFGDRLDDGNAEYFAATARKNASQLWLSTRRSDATRAFTAREIIRLTIRSNSRRVNVLTEVTLREIGSAIRQLSLQLMPACTARSIFLCEGQHDNAVITYVALRRLVHQGKPLPASQGARLVETDGIEKIPKIAKLAKALGFHVVALIDHDKPGEQTNNNLRAVEEAADSVVRLPAGFAIERAIVEGADVSAVRKALDQIRQDEDLPWPLDKIPDSKILDFAVQNMKARGGLHLALLELMPGYLPTTVVDLLEHAERIAESLASETVKMGEA